MQTKRILITPAGTETGLEIYKSLRHRDDIELFAADTDPENPLFPLLGPQKSMVVPSLGHEDFWSVLEQIVDRYHIDYIYPTHDWFLPACADKGQGSNPYGVKYLVSSVSAVRRTSDKRLCYQTFPHLSPRIYEYMWDITGESFPLFIKPNNGRGSIGAFKVETPAELDFYSHRINDAIIAEYLPGPEYTVDCISNKDGILLQCCARRRDNIKRGISHIATIIDHPYLSTVARQISSAIKPVGGWFFQMKESRLGTPKLLEVNLRVSGTMCLTRTAGLNIPLLTVLQAADEQVGYVPPPITGLTVTRHLTEEYIWPQLANVRCIVWDLDGTIWKSHLEGPNQEPILKENVLSLMRKLHERKYLQVICSRNPYLSTLTPVDQKNILAQWLPVDIFSEIRINFTEFKGKVIKEMLMHLGCNKLQTLFIDDSFNEREDVRLENPGILVADASICADLDHIERATCSQ